MNVINKFYDNDGNPVEQSQSEYAYDEAGAEFEEEICRDEDEVSDKMIYDQIKAISKENSHIQSAMRALENMTTEGKQVNDGFGVQGKANAISEVVRAREDTNKRMLLLLEKIYDERHGVKSAQAGTAQGADKVAEMDAKMKNFREVCSTLTEFTDNTGSVHDEAIEIVRELTRRIFPE